MPYRPCYAPLFRPSSALDCALLQLRYALLLIVLIVLYAVTFGSPGFLCMIQQTAYRMRHCREGNDDPTLDIGFTLDRWIRETPRIRDAIVWRPDGNTALHYRDWSTEDKRRLAALYDALVTTGTTDLPVEPAISEFRYSADENPDGQHAVASVSYSLDIARNTFFAHLAQSLFCEIRNLGSWSVLGFSDDELALLFDSIHMYGWDSDQERHVLFVPLGLATPGDPGRVFEWLRASAMIQGDSRSTVITFLEWCRGLFHDGGYLLDGSDVPDVYPGSRQGNEAHWQYEGFQPVERTLSGTRRLTSTMTEHWTHGCQGTTGLLRNVLRTINIPVRREDGCGHAVPHFVHERLFLSHGDDPYTVSMKDWTPQIPMSDIVIPDERLPGFFDDCNHVGRGVAEAIVRLLPDQLIQMRCRDVESGLSRVDGEVFSLLGRYMTMAELEASHFWDRLDAEITRRGGCSGLI